MLLQDTKVIGVDVVEMALRADLKVSWQCTFSPAAIKDLG